MGEVLLYILGRVTRCLPRRWEARAANEALHNRRKMVAETNRAKHLVKLCEAGMHADALREQLHDSAQDFTDFNHVKDAMIKHEQWVWKPPRSMIKSAEASGADKSKLESSAVLRKVQRDFRSMTLDRPGEKPMHLRAWPEVLKKERRHAQYMAELLGKEVAPEKQLEEMRCVHFLNTTHIFHRTGARCARRPRRP